MWTICPSIRFTFIFCHIFPSFSYLILFIQILKLVGNVSEQFSLFVLLSSMNDGINIVFIPLWDLLSYFVMMFPYSLFYMFVFAISDDDLACYWKIQFICPIFIIKIQISKIYYICGRFILFDWFLHFLFVHVLSSML